MRTNIIACPSGHDLDTHGLAAPTSRDANEGCLVTDPSGGTEGVCVQKGVVLRSRFGERVRTLLGQTGLSSEELAERSAIPAKRIESILSGSLIRITLRDMSIIAGVFGIPLYCFLVPADAPLPVVPFEVVEKRGSGHA